MSIEAKPWPSGGGASVVDASETTKGIIRIATSAEAATGTDDLTAMTPLTVKERIDAALVGGVQYQGTFDATAGTPSIANAEKGDLYIIDTAGTIYGQTWAVGDHLLINEDMGGSVTNSKIDKVDNTDAVTSVNTLTGAVVLSADDIAADHTAVNYTATNSNIDGHLSGIDTALASAGSNQINDIVTKTASSFTAESNYVYVGGYTSGTQTVTMPDASASTKGDIIGFSTLNGARSIELVSSDGTTNDLLNISNATKGGTNGALAITVDRQISWFICDAVRWRETNAALSTVATTGAYSDISGTPTLATVATTGAYSDLSGTPTLATVATTGAYSDLSGTPTLATVATTGAYSDLSGTPTLATVATTGAYSDLSGTPTIPADLDDLSDVTITGTPASGEILEVNGSNQFVNVAKSSINLSEFNDDLSYQPLDAGLTSISGLTTSADKMIYTTASDTYAVADLTSAGRALLDDADASAQRTTLGLAIDSDVQAYDAGLASIAGLTTAADKMIYTTASDTYAVTDLTSAGRALLDDASASAQRTTLELGTAATSDTGDFLASTAAIGDISDVTITSVSNGQVLSYNSTSGDWENTTPTSGGATDLDGLSDVTITSATSGDLLQNNGSGQFVNVAKSTINLSSFNDDLSYQPLDAGLTSISGLTTSADKMIYTTASDTYAVTDLTSAGRALLDDADASAQRTTLGLVIDSDVQAYDAGLASIAGLTTSADKMIYTTASDTYAVTDLTSAGRTFLASTAAINDLSDVTISSVSNGQVLSYNSTSGDWENTTPTSGGTSYTYQAVTSASSPVTAQAWYHYSVDASGGAVTINLPALSSVSDGDEIRIKIRDASNDTTVDGNSTETIDGAQTQVLGVAYTALTLVAGSSEWEII